MKAIIQSESNFSLVYNFFLVKLQNQYMEVLRQKMQDKKSYWKSKDHKHTKNGIIKLKSFNDDSKVWVSSKNRNR